MVEFKVAKRLESVGSQLLQRPDIPLGELLVREVCKRACGPECEGTFESWSSSGDIASANGGEPFTDQGLEDLAGGLYVAEVATFEASLSPDAWQATALSAPSCSLDFPPR